MTHERTAMLEEDKMMEQALMPGNWEAALRDVERNDGAPGPDGMRAGELRAHLGLHGEVIRSRLLEGATSLEPQGERTSPKPAAAPGR